jgi:hypothetical protein
MDTQRGTAVMAINFYPGIVLTYAASKLTWAEISRKHMWRVMS